jgi:hypothetical protein
MRYAVDDRLRREVDAFDVHGVARCRTYSCPVCRAPVHFRSSMARSPDPGFAHNKYAARPDCELYHPGMAGYVFSPSIRPEPSAEDSLEEIGMCYEEEGRWRIYLRLPEISDLGDLPLSALQPAAVRVGVAGTTTAIPLMDLRPGTGVARVVVPPSEHSYKVSPDDSWPAGLPNERWLGSARGLNPDGTLFVQRRGEWVRLRAESSLDLGTEIRVVALQSRMPPIPCTEVSGRSQRDSTWRAWRVLLPTEATSALEEWAYELGVYLTEPSWTVAPVTVPLSFLSGLPVFGTGESIVARLRSPAGRSQTMVTCGAGSNTTSVPVISSETSLAYLTVNVAWAGTNELRAGIDNPLGFSFLTECRPELPEVRAALRKAPRLAVRVGERVYECWTGRHELPVVEEAIRIDPEFEELRLGLHWKGEGGNGTEEGLTRGSAARRLAAFFGQAVDVCLSAGALGSVLLAFPAARKPRESQSPTYQRPIVRNAGMVGAWMLRQGVGRVRGRNRWTSLAINRFKESRDNQ